MPHVHLISAIAFASAVLAACSTLSSILPSGPDPVCGPSIQRGSVRVLDMTAYGMREASISDAIEERVGPYRIMTAEPVWIPRRSMHGEGAYAGSIATVQSIAADWGCNLLILLNTKMDRTSIRTQSRNEERVWLVHAGRVGGSG